MWYEISPEEIINLDFCQKIGQVNYFNGLGEVPSIGFILKDNTSAYKVFEDKEDAEAEFERLKDFFLKRIFINEF